MTYGMHHEDLDSYTLTVSENNGIDLTCIWCGERVSPVENMYLSFASRQAVTHSQMCSVVNRQGAHTQVR